MSAPSGTICVLLVEDDARLARLTAKYLESHGLVVIVVGDGREAVSTALRVHPDVVVLDLMLPGIDGFEVCRRLRERMDVPVLMVTARGEESDRVLGLEGGADDYLVKPLSSRELLARIRAHVRRSRGELVRPEERIEVGALCVEPRSMKVTFGGRELSLTSYEFALLRALAERAGSVLTREQLMERMRGSSEQTFDRSIDVHVSHLRAKLGDDPRNPRLVKTVRGLGYMLAVETL